uniref:hypothetical protein n=1 Tax=Castellaniella defragrans TaxID=75697 RepID=UPI003340F5E8
MKIKIERITCRLKGCDIQFSSAYGESSAGWVGQAPAIGETHDVELEIADDLVWGMNVHATAQTRASIERREGVFVMVGAVIESGEDGCLALAVGGSVVLLDVKNVPGDIVGSVECRALNVTAYPANM